MAKMAIADDYAILDAAGLRFYYGYEVELDGMWCFTVEQDGDAILQLKSSELDAYDMFDVQNCLLLGIAKWMEITKSQLDSQGE